MMACIPPDELAATRGQIAEIVRLDRALKQRFQQRFSLQPSLSRALVSFQANKGRPIYRWYKYKEAFSAALVEIMLDRVRVTKGHLLDPFNIDLVLLKLAPERATSGQHTEPQSYLALGELKGGIDPADADEHWKTARTALSRIREAFQAVGQAPLTFFIAAAIEKRMADEIWNDLESETLSNAANLTNDDQLAAVANWLCSL